MAIEFINPVVGGVTLIREAIQSQNFSSDADTGVTGWQIAADGSATFYNVTIGSEDYFIDENGNASFNDVSVNGNLSVGGQSLTEILAERPRGIQYWGSRTSASSTTSGSTEMAVLTLGTTLANGRMYRISTSEMRLAGTTVGDTFAIRVRDGGSANPTTSSNQLFSGAAQITLAGASTTSSISAHQVLSCDSTTAAGINNLHPGTHNLLLTLARNSGTGTGQLETASATVNAIQLYVEDLGPLVANTGVNQTGTGSGGPPPVTTRTTTYNATWSATYRQDGSRRGDAVDGMRQYQGFYSSTNGNQRGLIGFDFAQIQADLAGATINKCEFYVYFNHWYFASGGNAVIGTHNSLVTANDGPATYPVGNVSPGSWGDYGGWGVNVGKWLNLGTAIGNQFKSGAATGMLMGPGVPGAQGYYGSYNGDNMTNEPKLRITYTK